MTIVPETSFAPAIPVDDVVRSDKNLFFIDTGKRVRTEEKPEKEPAATAGSGAWIDNDDEKTNINLAESKHTRRLRKSLKEKNISGAEYHQRLRSVAEAIHPRPAWAQIQETEEERGDDGDSFDSILRNPFAIIREKRSAETRGPLLPDVIGVRRFRNANFQSPSRAPIVSAEFHPTKPWILVASKDRVVNIFETDCLENKLLYTVKVQDWPRLNFAAFSADGNKVIICGEESNHLIVWHIAGNHIDKIRRVGERKDKEWRSIVVSKSGQDIALLGDDGYIVVISGGTFQLKKLLKLNGKVSGCAFSADGKVLFAVGSDNRVYIWETKTFKCVGMVSDDSGTECTSVFVSANGAHLGVGSNLGIMNIYEVDDLLKKNAKSKPFRSLMNLTTSINSGSIHPACELLAYSSGEKKGALRLVHLGTGRVFSNWPKETSPLNRITTIAFDPSGKQMALGNHKGQVLIYGLRHYE